MGIKLPERRVSIKSYTASRQKVSSPTYSKFGVHSEWQSRIVAPSDGIVKMAWFPRMNYVTVTSTQEKVKLKQVMRAVYSLGW